MTYSEAMVESLLPSVFDRTYAWGVQNDSAPDPDMPKSKYKSPKEATTYWCHLIDIRIAWANAPIFLPEKRALFLYYALGWTQAEIGVREGVSHVAINKRLAKGTRILADWLNADWNTENALNGAK